MRTAMQVYNKCTCVVDSKRGLANRNKFLVAARQKILRRYLGRCDHHTHIFGAREWAHGFHQ